ncbi:hypothetical protein LSH36_271g03013 [Paralvinella palmiformis]|uniref:Uncharacterized protein n=1 Tax=Paralvinella palmiformis TaxID=53620 RepID=A0AAD9JJN5_9ANNE|nr:hypothetical protein LSH36_271g03013 [Paralvinella palmiformis]
MPMQWGSKGATSNILAGQFPQFQISAADVKRGAVVVNATSPSGKTHRMTVQEKNGVYTANFTPTEVGDWNIAILYDGQHIQGSPFDVRVYDASRVRVMDPLGGAVGKMFAFTVKADGAGEGKLDVNIVHNGTTIPATIVPTNPALQQFDVHFTPPSNSPFKLEIIDSNAVTATGNGLTSTAINTNAEFIINTGTTAKDGDLRVEITGEYIIDVYFYGKPIKGSPYRVQAYDLSSIHVTVPSIGIVDKLVEFDINAARAGSGNLEIMVNDGKIPCSVQNRVRPDIGMSSDSVSTEEAACTLVSKLASDA